MKPKPPIEAPNEFTRIVDQLRRAYTGEAWHGPSLMEALDGVSAEAAAKKPIPNAHSIWELVLHITTWVNVTRRRFQGEAVQVSEAEDFPPVAETSEAAWRAALAGLQKANHDLIAAIAAAGDEPDFVKRLNATVPGKDHSVYVLLHGIVQHNLYHAGQIVLLKKALS
jgi:uncharacterized damage-inducible protein DinB